MKIPKAGKVGFVFSRNAGTSNSKLDGLSLSDASPDVVFDFCLFFILKEASRLSLAVIGRASCFDAGDSPFTAEDGIFNDIERVIGNARDAAESNDHFCMIRTYTSNVIPHSTQISYKAFRCSYKWLVKKWNLSNIEVLNAACVSFDIVSSRLDGFPHQ